MKFLIGQASTASICIEISLKFLLSISYEPKNFENEFQLDRFAKKY